MTPIYVTSLDRYSSKNSEKSPRPIGPRTLGPRALSPWYLKSMGPWGQGPEVRRTLGPRPLGPWDLMCQGLKVRGPKVRGPMGQGLLALESIPLSYYKYNGGSSVNAPGRPSWMSSCLVSKMQRKRAATAFCSISHVEKIWLY